MARVALAVQSATVAGLNAVYTAVGTGTGNGVKHNPQAILHVKNAGGSSVTLTVITPGSPGGNDIADRTVTVPAAGDRFLDLSELVYRNSDGLVYVDASAAVTAAALTL